MAIKDISDLDVRAALAATDRLAFYPTGSDIPESGVLTQLADFLATQGFWRMLASSAVAASHTGNTTETTLATIPIPGGEMGPNGILKITTLWSYTNSADDKFLRTKFNGTTYNTQTATTTQATQNQIIIRNRNSQSSQVGMSNNATGFGNSAGALVTSAHNTSGTLNVTLTAQLEATGDTITLEGYTIELGYGA